MTCFLKESKNHVLGPILPDGDFLQNTWLCHTQLYMGPEHHAKFQKKLMSQFSENLRTDGRTLPAAAGGPKILVYSKVYFSENLCNTKTSKLILYAYWFKIFIFVIIVTIFIYYKFLYLYTPSSLLLLLYCTPDSITITIHAHFTST